MRALSMSLIGLLLLFLQVPLVGLVGVALLVAAIVTGIRARRRARRILTRAPGAMGGIVIGAIGLVLIIAGLAMVATVATEFGDYQKCHSSALTITDKQTCNDRYIPKIEHKLHLPKGSLKDYPGGF
jgi:hypothetical protein